MSFPGLANFTVKLTETKKINSYWQNPGKLTLFFFSKIQFSDRFNRFLENSSNFSSKLNFAVMR